MFPPGAEATEWLILFRRDAFLLIIRNICFVMQNHKNNFIMQESILFVYAFLFRAKMVSRIMFDFSK